MKRQKDQGQNAEYSDKGPLWLATILGLMLSALELSQPAYASGQCGCDAQTTVTIEAEETLEAFPGRTAKVTLKATVNGYFVGPWSLTHARVRVRRAHASIPDRGDEM